jgi:S-adenosylmethionine:tRNA ribosyltransferase-isomerase
LRTSDFDYELPAKFIAQSPLEQRDHSRLLILDCNSGEIQHATFVNIGDYLKPGDILVLNETRVIPARLFARKVASGGKVEMLLLRKRDELTWEALVGGKGLIVGKQLQVQSGDTEENLPKGVIIEELEGSERLIRFDQPLEQFFDKIGHVPLPPYIHQKLTDPERYQTIYALKPGSAAAPTAGLHFTAELIAQLKRDGIHFATVTLHVGLDTFAPVNEGNPQEHKIHTEWCQVTTETADRINQIKNQGGRVIAVGTTSVRTLESAAVDGKLQAFEGSTDLFILPGYKFTVINGMVTNFHLPRSTLIMLVSALAGRKKVMNAYEIAKQANYRFYSFGDAMLIIC